MDGKLTPCILVFAVALQSLANGHVFFHELSSVLVKPIVKPKTSTDFGFSLGHWDGHLIVSSPNSTLDGEMFRCPLSGIKDNELSCSLLNVFNSTTSSRNLNPSQNFYLGASIAPTEKFLFTCAPLVTKDLIRISTPEKCYPDAYGSCFVTMPNGTTIEHQGPEARFQADGRMPLIAGGTGWNTLVDEENDLMFVAKTSVSGFLYYLRISDPLSIPRAAFSDKDYRGFSSDVLDLGYGITAGKFFSNETVYAVSKQSKAMTGHIIFIEQYTVQSRQRRRLRNNTRESSRGPVTKSLRLMLLNANIPHMINSNKVGSMFGYCLAAADLNSDGFAELLVGAPLQSEDDNEIEFGAVHIYIGGKIEAWTDGTATIRTIFGTKSMGRFGSTIATADIDGDSISEVFVSAPYEDTGVVYILSGHDLKSTLQKTTQLQTASSMAIQVSKLRHTQKVVRAGTSLFGFSLLPVPDMDGNGCNELAIGAPGSASALLLRSIQAINVTVSVDLVNQDVMEKDGHCTVKVCLNIEYNKKSKNITGNIQIKNYVSAPAKFENPIRNFDLSKIGTMNPCHDFLVKLPFEVREYEVTTELKVENTKVSKDTDFDASWVTLSTYSNTKGSLKFKTRCNGTDCNPDLDVNIKWSHPQTTDLASKGTKKIITGRPWYNVESTANEKVSVFVTNHGFEATAACVVVQISGATVHKPGRCTLSTESSPNNKDATMVFECPLPEHFRRTENITFEIALNMTTLSTATKKLVIEAQPYEFCPQKNSNDSRKKTLEIDYRFKDAWNKVQLDGESQDLQITDLEISEELEKNKDYEENTDNVFRAIHQYKIINSNGSVAWDGVQCVIDFEDRPFFTKVTTGHKDCRKTGQNQHTCFVKLMRRESKTIIFWAEMSRQKVGESLNSGHPTNVISKMKMCMDNTTNDCIEKSLVTAINFKTDILFKNNKMLIALVAGILALLLLALVSYCLFKNGFFQRKEKKKLNVLRESVRRHSVRLASEKSSRHSRNMSHKTPSNIEEENDIDIEVVDDCPFDEVPIGSKDDVILIDAKADVHDDKAKKEAKDEHAKKA